MLCVHSILSVYIMIYVNICEKSVSLKIYGLFMLEAKTDEYLALERCFGLSSRIESRGELLFVYKFSGMFKMQL